MCARTECPPRPAQSKLKSCCPLQRGGSLHLHSPLLFISKIISRTAGPVLEPWYLLRLPGARRKHEPALNLAYAFVVSPSFAAAAQGLRDALVEAGRLRPASYAFVDTGSVMTSDDTHTQPPRLGLQ